MHALPEEERKALSNLGRFAKPLGFFGYQGKDGGGAQVDIIGDLVLAVPDGDGRPPIVLPSLRACIVPGQIDDVLISASDLDRLGFDASSSDTHFHLNSIGFAVPRSAGTELP